MKRLDRLILNAWGRIADPKRAGLREHYAEVATDVVVNLNDGGRRENWHTFYALEDYVDAFAHLRALGLRVHVMTWVRPDFDRWAKPMLDGLSELREAAGFDSVLLDLEGPWARGFPGRRPGPADRKRIRGEVAGLVGERFVAEGVEFGVTDVPRVAWSLVSPWLPFVSYVMPQCHGFAGRLPGSIRRPGKLVEEVFGEGRLGWAPRLPEGVELIPHVAFYKAQTNASTRAQIETAVACGAKSVAGWTGRNGPKRPKVLRSYVREIRECSEGVS